HPHHDRDDARLCAPPRVAGGARGARAPIHQRDRLGVQPAGTALAAGDHQARRGPAGRAAMRPIALAAGLAALAVSLVVGIAVGSVPLGIGDVWDGLLRSDAAASTIVRQLRVPRVLLAFLVGGGLGLSGAALQALVRNPLADPYLLGLSGGAGLGAVLAIAARTGGAWVVPASAFAGALAAVALVYRLSLVGGRRLDPRVLLLAGVVVGAFASAVMSAV